MLDHAARHRRAQGGVLLFVVPLDFVDERVQILRKSEGQEIEAVAG